MVRIFGLTLFLSSALLFLVQPMIGRLILPVLGGAPAVWNTCLVFFQAVLLGGYLYAHLLPSWLGERRHALLHIALLLLPFLCLPIALPCARTLADDSPPVLEVLGLLLVSVGLPFFLVATSSPLLQRWFAGSTHPHASDPYYLYAASNLGSLAALLGYPLLVEPLLPLADQGRLWMAGYIVFFLLTSGCAVWFWRTADRALVYRFARSSLRETINQYSAPLAWKRRLRWLVLAFVPSSLMLSVTTYVTTDIAAIPLLWMAPLALYLLTFILAFARKQWISPRVLTRWMPALMLVIVLVLLSEATEPLALLLALHLIGLFWIGLLCHMLLAQDRPPSERLTEFYLCVSVGGLLGGVLNALLAPLMFCSIAEYPVVLILACFLRPAPVQAPRLSDIALPLGLGALTIALVRSGQMFGLEPGPLSIAWVFAVPLVICYTFLERPLRFGLGITAVLLAAGAYGGIYGPTLYRTRSFFGVHRVALDPSGCFRLLVHGDTVHGRQSLDPAQAREPLGYYYRNGPIGDVFQALHGDERLQKVAVVGLGAGALSCYAEPGQCWTFYEIDPAVVTVARDSGLFTYLTCGPVPPALVLGDARLKLESSKERYGLLVIDAFNSDAIPIHLLTREALQIYWEHLYADGILAFNISNRYFDLESVLADLAGCTEPPLVCLAQKDVAIATYDKQHGKAPSHWVVMARQRAALEKVIQQYKWRKVQGRADRVVWTDDYCNLLGVLKWRSNER